MMGYNGEAARLCTQCSVPHVENCPDCFGFGLYAPDVPVSAHDAIAGTLHREALPCPTCGGTVAGAPVAVSND